MKRLLLSCLLALCGLCASLAQAQWEVGTDGMAPIPKLAARVTDLTGTLSAGERTALETKLAAWEQSSGNQLVVLLIPSTKPEPIEAYSIRVADAWKIGRKGQDNGALFLVAKDDKKMRIEAGYGLEGSLTDAASRRIIAEKVGPKFSAGQFAAGINDGVDEIIAIVNKGEPPAGSKPVPTAKRGISPNFDIGTLFVLVFVIVPVLGMVLRGIFGRALGSTIGAGIIGVGAWVVVSSLVIAGIAGVIAFFVMLAAGTGGGLARRGGGGGWIPTGGGGFGGGGFGGGGGGFSGGGGGFGGGGASGGWN